ncbi:MAG: ABC transporter substrate-binding protein [Ignavibacteriaceae bacterium]
MAKSKILTILFLLFFCSLSKAQSDDANQEFRLALNFYNTRNYNDALQLFDRIISSELNSRTTVAFLFKGKTLLKLDRQDEAISTLNQFLNIYPNSDYSDEARMVITKSYIVEEKYQDAFEELNQIISVGKSADYINQAKLISKKIAVDYLAPGLIKNIYENTTSERLKPFLLLLLGEVYLTNGNSVDGLKVFSKINSLYPDSPENVEAKTYNPSSVENYQSNSRLTLIGVMLPLFSNNSAGDKTPVTEILDGIKFAVSQYNRTHSNRIGLVIRDTERNNDKIREIANEFKNISSIKTVLGPIFSDEVVAAADAFAGSNIKIFSPTATDNDLAHFDNNVYQANPSFAVRGKTMADFVFYNEKKLKMGVINSNTGYSQKLADAFITEYENLGGQVLTHQIYSANSIEITQQINQMLPFANSLEGIYAPISDKNDATVILSSLVLDSLYLPMYGNQDWFLAKGMETSTTLSNNLVMTSDYFIDFKDQKFEDLSKKFFTETGNEMNRNVLYGYDAANYLLQILDETNNDPNKMAQFIYSGFSFKGIHNDLLFDDNHVNKILNFVRYKDGVYHLIKRYNAIN